jgi:hypothetical protein
LLPLLVDVLVSGAPESTPGVSLGPVEAQANARALALKAKKNPDFMLME